jgi:hypothetical protein
VQPVADAGRADARNRLGVLDDAAAAERDRDEVRHPEVRTDPADFDGRAGLAREPVDEHADVGRRAAHICHESVRRAGQEGRAADAVRRAAADREHGVADGVVEGHQSPVVLGEEDHGLEVMRCERRLERSRDSARHRAERRVHDRRVLAFEQTDRPDLVAERDRQVAQLLADDVRGGRLMLVRDRGEHARHRDRLGLTGHLAEEGAQAVLAQRNDLAAVELHPSADDRLADGDRLTQIRGPVVERRDGCGRRGPDPDNRHPLQAGSLEHRVGGVRRAEHDMTDPARLDGGLGEDGVQGGGDTSCDVSARRSFGFRHQGAVSVEDRRIGVRPADVDPQAQVGPGVHAASFSIGT